MFDFKPQIVIVSPHENNKANSASYNAPLVMMGAGRFASFNANSVGPDSAFTKILDPRVYATHIIKFDTEVSWWSESFETQMNKGKCTFSYVAFG